MIIGPTTDGVGRVTEEGGRGGTMVSTGGIVLHLTAQAGTTTPEEESGQKQEEEENRRLLMDGDDSKTRWAKR